MLGSAGLGMEDTLMFLLVPVLLVIRVILVTLASLGASNPGGNPVTSATIALQDAAFPTNAVA